jgi:hypothetical protein
MNELKMFDDAVRALSRQMFHGGHALKELPGSLKEVLGRNRWNRPMWPERVDAKTGEVYRFERFEDFVTAEPLAGLGADLAKLEAICQDDADALVMLRKALVKPVGRPSGKRETSDNVTNLDGGRGNTKSYTLSRLQQHHPDLYERVKAKQLSANAAAKEAGFRKPPDPYQQMCRLWEKILPEERAAFEDFIGQWRRQHT